MSRSFKSTLLLAFLKYAGKLPLSFSRGLGYCTGLILAVTSNRARAVTEENLRTCFPQLTQQENKRLTRESLIQSAQFMFETPAVWLKRYDWVRKRILKIEGLELLKQSVAQGRGVIVLGPHIGNWEVCGLYLSEVVPVTSLYKPPTTFSEVEGIIRSSREKAGATLVPTDRKGIVTLLKAIKGGGVTGILPDQVPDASGGSFAPFFGQQAWTMTLANNLRSRSNAIVLAAYAKRVTGGFEVVFSEADPQVYSDDESQALAAMNRTIEACVRAIPSQYQWEYKRFKVRPEGEPKLYRKAP